MHKLSITFVLVCSIFPVLTHAVKVCGIDVQIPNRIAKPVTCSNCRTFTDFAMYGGAILNDLSLTNIRVRNNNGVDAEVSIQRYIPHPTGANISTDILRRLGIQINLPDPYRSAITVDAIKGYIFGQRWDSRKIPDTSLDAKCKQIEKEQETIEKAQKERQRAIINEGIYDTSSYWQNGNPHFLFKPPKRKVWVPVTGDESCGTEPCPWWDDEEYSDAYTRIDTIPYWYRELLERRNEQLEPRITTEEIRSSGGGRGGFGFGGFAVAPGGVAESQHGTEKVK